LAIRAEDTVYGAGSGDVEAIHEWVRAALRSKE